MSEQTTPDEHDEKPKRKRRTWVRVLIWILATIGGLLCLAVVVIVGGVGYFIYDFSTGPGQAGRALLRAIVAEDYETAHLHVGSQYGDTPEEFEQIMIERGFGDIERIVSVKTTGANEGGTGSARAVVMMNDGTERTISMGAGYRGSAPENWVISTIGFVEE